MKVLVERAGGEERMRAMINAVEARSGKTALHFAAERGHSPVVTLLLKQGAGTILATTHCIALRFTPVCVCMCVVESGL
jgi:hypothetical protein